MIASELAPAVKKHKSYADIQLMTRQCSVASFAYQPRSYSHGEALQIPNLEAEACPCGAPREDIRYVGTFHGIEVYGHSLCAKTGMVRYRADTELHVVWDLDSTLYPGQGCNDLELWLSSLLCLKEFFENPDGSSDVADAEADSLLQDNGLKKLVQDVYVENLMQEVLPIVLRPHATDFAQHCRSVHNAKWWTYTNKAHNLLQPTPDGFLHANMATRFGRAAARCIIEMKNAANRLMGIHDEFPIMLGRPGSAKDVAHRVTRALSSREGPGVPVPTRITIALIDDTAYASCGTPQATHASILLHVEPYLGLDEARADALRAVVERILPTWTISELYAKLHLIKPPHLFVQVIDSLCHATDAKLLFRV